MGKTAKHARSNGADQLTLDELRAADLVLRRARRERPQGYRSTLHLERRGPTDVPEDQILWAFAIADIVAALKPRLVQGIISALMTQGLDGRYVTQKQLAFLLGLSDRTVRRHQERGLEKVRRAMAEFRPNIVEARSAA